MALSLKIGKCTLLGNYRENNEDAIEAKELPNFTACIVADGMGGQAYGEVASKRAIDVVPRELKKLLTEPLSRDEICTAIRRSVLQANEEIITLGTLDREMKNMGSTIVLAIWPRGPEIFIANLGDSRAYLIRSGKIEQLTVDHTVTQALVENKTISAAEAKEHRYRNTLWKFLGSTENGAGPDVVPVAIQTGDCILLCSDGLTGPVPDETLLEFIQAHRDAQACADGLGQLALDMGSRDNVSAIVIQVV